jgi:hypothetical protein
MRAALIGLLLLCAGCGSTFGDSQTLTSENAKSVAESYRHLSKEYPSSCALCLNLGNACLFTDKLPEALIAYHKGLRLCPNNGELRDHLDYARTRVQYPPGKRGQPRVDAWPEWLFQPSSFMTLLMAFIFYGAGCFLVTRWFMTGRRRLIVRAIVTFILAGFFGLTWAYLERLTEEQTRFPLVVIHEDKVLLRKGNGPSYPANPDLPVLTRGMEAKKINERGNWLQIQFAGGAVGWVENSAVLVDEP